MWRPVLPDVFTNDSDPFLVQHRLDGLRHRDGIRERRPPGSRSKSTKSGRSRSFTREAQMWKVSVPWLTR